MMEVSFITSLYNCLLLTQEMVASLHATLPAGLAHEIILIDDGSTDGTREWLATLRAPVRVLLNERNLGFAGSNNRAARSSTGRTLFFLNNDLVLLPGWFEPMRAALARCSRPGFVGNLQLIHGASELDHRGVRFDPLGRPYHDRRWLTFTCLQSYSRYPAVTAACCAIARDTFFAAGGFDEAYRNGYEDIDLCLRLRQRGHHHFVANRSVVRHHISASADRFIRETENLKLFLRRWGPPATGPKAVSNRLRGWCYLVRYWNQPWRYNGPKLLLALARLASNRPCDSLIARWNITGATT